MSWDVFHLPTKKNKKKKQECAYLFWSVHKSNQSVRKWLGCIGNTIKSLKDISNIYSLIVPELLHQQADRRARRIGASTGIWSPHSAWTSAGWSSGLACWGWSPLEAEDWQAVQRLSLALLTWWWQLDATGSTGDTNSAGSRCLLWILPFSSVSLSKALRGIQPTSCIVFIPDNTICWHKNRVMRVL